MNFPPVTVPSPSDWHSQPVALDVLDLEQRFPSTIALITRDVKRRASARLYTASGAHQKRYRRLKRLKLCVFCAKPRGKYVLCEACRVPINAKLASKYHGNRTVDACTDCRGIPAAGRSRCDPCSERRAKQPSRDWSYRREKERPGSRVSVAKSSRTCGCGSRGVHRRQCPYARAGP